jgi:DNA helicase II / ATP-dependent DNA helicase PcrA
MRRRRAGGSGPSKFARAVETRPPEAGTGKGRSRVSLNREQRQAAAELEGPVRVVAGAGTGKTAVIAERFHRLVAAGAEPSSILVMTFTERAAAEMRGRIESGLSSYSGDLWIGTFHSIAQTLLREDGWRIGVPPTFRVLAGADRWIQMRELLWQLGDPALIGVERPDDLVNPLLRLLERLKQELIPFARLEDWARTCEDRELGEQLLAAVRLFRANRQRSDAERLLDFDDLILQVVRLLESRPEARERNVKRFTSVLVDEYQDSNLAQERMVELLAGSGNVSVVGDDDQSIYRFRGASLASMERFVRSFPTAVTRTLGRNRRSTAHVVAAAASLISNNPQRMAKSLTAFRGAGPRVDLGHAATGLDESLHIAAEVAALAASGVPLRRIALLVRTNALARPVVLALRAAGIPHQLWGARGFYRRPEILDAIAYLRLLADPTDELAISRLAVRPATGLDPLEVFSRLAAARAGGVPPLRALEQWEGTQQWVGVIRRLVGLSARLGIDELFFELMASTGYLEVAAFESESEQRQVAANLAKFGEVIDAFCDRRRDLSLGAFMAYMDLVLVSETDEEVAQTEDIEAAVQVMTIHQAKGLEFDAVFVPALVEGRLPQPHRGDRFRIPAQLAGEAGGREDQVAEERRLLYVAMTRARDRLQLSWADSYEGSRAWRPSRFIEEIEGAGRRHVRRKEIPPLGASLAGHRLNTLEMGEDAPPDGLAVRPAPPDSAAVPRLSFSGISTYRECPRQYQYRYVHRLPVPTTVEAQYGNILHAALQALGKLRMEMAAVTEEALERVHEQVWEEMPFPDPRRLPAMRALGRRQLLAYLAGGGFATRPALVEETFTAELDGWRLRGIIDRVDPPPTLDGGGRAKGHVNGGAIPVANSSAGTWRIIDYKTGDPIPASRLRRDLQLALYALGARRALGLDELELEIVYLKDASRVLVPAGNSLLKEAEEIGGEVASSISAGRFEPRPERRRCALCAYRLACPAAL